MAVLPIGIPAKSTPIKAGSKALVKRAFCYQGIEYKRKQLCLSHRRRERERKLLLGESDFPLFL